MGVEDLKDCTSTHNLAPGPAPLRPSSAISKMDDFFIFLLGLYFRYVLNFFGRFFVRLPADALLFYIEGMVNVLKTNEIFIKIEKFESRNKIPWILVLGFKFFSFSRYLIDFRHTFHPLDVKNQGVSRQSDEKVPGKIQNVTEICFQQN